MLHLQFAPVRRPPDLGPINRTSLGAELLSGSDPRGVVATCTRS